MGSQVSQRTTRCGGPQPLPAAWSRCFVWAGSALSVSIGQGDELRNGRDRAPRRQGRRRQRAWRTSSSTRRPRMSQARCRPFGGTSSRCSARRPQTQAAMARTVGDSAEGGSSLSGRRSTRCHRGRSHYSPPGVLTVTRRAHRATSRSDALRGPVPVAPRSTAAGASRRPTPRWRKGARATAWS